MADYHKKRPWPNMSLSEEIMKLDNDIIQLLVRRSGLMQKLRKGKTHAATPGIIRSEKEIRSAWEAQASKVSHNPRLVRQLFAMIQDLDIQPQKESPSSFNLAPARLPVEVNVPAPVAGAYNQLWITLAAYCGKDFVLEHSNRGSALMDTVKAFSQCGCPVDWQDNGKGISVLAVKGGVRPGFYDKSIYLGDDTLNLYLFAFLGAGQTGRIRMTGGAGLKEADLSALGRFMLALGARLAWVVPGTKGLPAALECSGALPDKLEVPADLPREAVLALLLAALSWGRRIDISLPEIFDNDPDLQLLKPVFKAFPGAVQVSRRVFAYSGEPVCEKDFPASVKPVVSPSYSAYLLALPMFAGGTVELSGSFSESSYYDEIISFLKSISLDIKLAGGKISSSVTPNVSWPQALESGKLSAVLHPLFWALNARLAYRAGGAVRIAAYPANADLDMATDFLAQVGIDLQRDGEAIVLAPMSAEDFKLSASKSHGWSSPDELWGLAMALGAFLKPNLKMSNPECVSDRLPLFWHIYNGLPAPKLRQASSKAPEKAEPSRRRIMTDKVIEPDEMPGQTEE